MAWKLITKQFPGYSNFNMAHSDISFPVVFCGGVIMRPGTLNTSFPFFLKAYPTALEKSF